MRKYYMPLILLPVIGLVALLVPNTNKIISIWYSDLGAVQMSQAELRSFPTNQWATVEMIPRLETAEISLRSALQYNPNNQTANYRLGMISLLRQDFESASTSLETAYKQAPGHRGIIKNLGYAYVWLGKLDKAKRLLGQIPEAQEELNVYSWWWNTQGRHDLSEKASDLASGLNSTGVQY
jgi:tetratricopeptide (TPR) repeat protein